MPMKNPAHPGRIVKSACLEPLGLTVTNGAKALGVTRQTLIGYVETVTMKRKENPNASST